MGLVLTSFGAAMREPVTTTSSTTGAAVASVAGAVCAVAVSVHALTKAATKSSTPLVSGHFRFTCLGPMVALMFSPLPRSVVSDLHNQLGRSRQLQTPMLLRRVWERPCNARSALRRSGFAVGRRG